MTHSPEHIRALISVCLKCFSTFLKMECLRQIIVVPILSHLTDCARSMSARARVRVDTNGWTDNRVAYITSGFLIYFPLCR
jgi:hypothetical protein